jgi:hypothetical protein
MRLPAVFASSALAILIGACLRDDGTELTPSSLEKQTQNGDALRGDVFKAELQEARKALREVMEGKRKTITPREHNVLLLKVLRDALAGGGASAVYVGDPAHGADMTLRMVETYFRPGGTGQRLPRAEAMRRAGDGDDSPQVGDALVAYTLLDALRKSACYSYRRDPRTGLVEILGISSDCSPSPVLNENCCWIQCKDSRVPGFKKCSNCCDAWTQLEINDPEDPGVVYVTCFDEAGNGRSCPPAR